MPTVTTEVITKTIVSCGVCGAKFREDVSKNLPPYERALACEQKAVAKPAAEYPIGLQLCNPHVDINLTLAAYIPVQYTHILYYEFDTDLLSYLKMQYSKETLDKSLANGTLVLGHVSRKPERTTRRRKSLKEIG